MPARAPDRRSSGPDAEKDRVKSRTVPPVEHVESGAHEAGTLPIGVVNGQLPPDAPQVTSWGPYKDLELLGFGGMGVVYRALDTTLDRQVALKFLRGRSPELVDRFFREARAQARLRHEHVCSVYEAGECDGNPFIAMQYIEGEQLASAAQGLSLEHKVRVMRDVSEAVHEAHRIGLVHRDLKPANIMLCAQAEGGFKPYVLDFGLVRDELAPGVTTTGEMLGTPAYMSPEQALGDSRRVDRRSDVYSLGAILYFVLVGHPPFKDINRVQQLVKIVEEEPPAVRSLDPTIPADLETIAMKCLEKEPQARYPSARAVAEELQRFLDGEPIEARAISEITRILRRFRKQKALVVAIATALAATLMMSGVWMVERWKAGRRAALAQVFGQDAKDMEWLMRVAHMSPIHDIAREQHEVQRRMRDIESRMRREGELAVPPGSYALGRGYLALGNPEQARSYLEKAWLRDFRHPDVAYALGLTLGRLYQRELETIECVSDERLRQGRREVAEREYRDPALGYLRASRREAVADAAYLEGLIALYERRFDDALERAMHASQAAPWLYESKILEGDTLLGLATQTRERGLYSEAIEIYRRGIGAYGEAVRIAQSDERGYEGICEAWINIMIAEMASSVDRVETSLDNAMSACQLAVQVKPDNAPVFARQAVAYRLWASSLQGKGEDPSDALERALDVGRRAIEIDPSYGHGHEAVGAVSVERARYDFAHGRDPRPALGAALASFEEASECRPLRASVFDWIGSALRLRAWFEWSRGIDPVQSFQDAVAAYERAIEIAPDSVVFRSSLADVYATLANYKTAHGIDARPDLERAVTEQLACLERNPNDAGVCNGLATVFFTQAEGLLALGQDPGEAVDRSLSYAEKAAAVNPGDEYPHFAAGYASFLKARYEVLADGEPQMWIERSIDSFEHCLEINQEYPYAHVQMGNAWRLRALYLMEHGRDPTGAVEAAAVACRRALEVDPGSSDGYLAYGLVQVLAACWHVSQQSVARVRVTSALASLERALELNNGDARIYRALAQALRVGAEVEGVESELGVPLVDRGIAAAETALKINPRLWEAEVERAALVNIRAALEPAPVQVEVSPLGRAKPDADYDNPLLRRHLDRVLGSPGAVGPV